MPRTAAANSARTERRIALVRSRPQPFNDAAGEVFSVVQQIRGYRRPMTAAELGTVLGRSEDVIYALVRKQKIPAFKLPGSKLIQFDPSTIVHWLQKHNPVLKDVQKAS